MKKLVIICLLLFFHLFSYPSIAQSNTQPLDSLLNRVMLMAKRGDLKTAKNTAILLLTNFKDTLSTSKIYNFVGDLCMQNKHYCMQGNSLEQRYIYLFAYDMYEKAGNQQGMKNAKEFFPTLINSFTCAPPPQQEH